MDRTTTVRTVLVMWEHSAEHSPIWSRSAELDGGPIDVRDLGLDETLRDDLADWNRRCEVAADPSDLRGRPPTAGEVREREVEAFALAARVQRGLGDPWTVWCLGGGGDGGMREAGAFGHLRRTAGPQILLRDDGPVTWTPSTTEPATDRLDASIRDELTTWRAAGGRSTAEHRAAGLELAGRLHATLPRGRVLWFGGRDVPS